MAKLTIARQIQPICTVSFIASTTSPYTRTGFDEYRSIVPPGIGGTRRDTTVPTQSDKSQANACSKGSHPFGRPLRGCWVQGASSQSTGDPGPVCLRQCSCRRQIAFCHWPVFVVASFRRLQTSHSRGYQARMALVAVLEGCLVGAGRASLPYFLVLSRAENLSVHV